MIKLFILQGANLNWLGHREPEKYGSTTAAELDTRIRAYVAEHGASAEIAYCNVEGDAIDRLYDAQRNGVAAVVVNPGGFSYAGYALRDTGAVTLVRDESRRRGRSTRARARGLR